MNNEIVNIQKDSVIAAYNTARNTNDYGTLHALESLFGKDLFKPKNIMERIKTFEDAVSELGEEHPYVEEYRKWTKVSFIIQEDIEAYFKLRIITAALNEGWKPGFTKEEYRHAPWFYIYSKEELEAMSEEERRRIVGLEYSHAIANGGLICAYDDSASSHLGESDGSRLALKSEELATYCGQQFIDIWADHLC